jgi:hypothetical protein
MKNKIKNISKIGMLLGLAAITALCVAQPVRAASSKPTHGGGSGGGSGSGSFYATVTNVTQLIADIVYANTVGGTITINLAPGATFDLTSANNTTDGGNGLPIIGGTKTVALTIIGNGDTIERIALISHNTVRNPFRLIEVAPGASLVLDRVTLKNGYASGSGAAGDAGAIYNQGTLTVNGSTVSGNSGTDIYNQGALRVNGSTVGGIYNSGSGATINDSTLGGINNQGTMTVTDSRAGHFDNGGTMTVNGSTLSGGGYAGGGISNAGSMALSNSIVSGSGGFYCYYGGGINNSGSAATMTISVSTVSGNSSRFGGGIYNNGGAITIKDSTVSGNSTYHYDYPWAGGYGGGIYNSAGTIVIDHSNVTGNTADPGLEDPSVGGGGIFNDSAGTVTVENGSYITGNFYDNVTNFGLLYLLP